MYANVKSVPRSATVRRAFRTVKVVVLSKPDVGFRFHKKNHNKDIRTSLNSAPLSSLMYSPHQEIVHWDWPQVPFLHLLSSFGLLRYLSFPHLQSTNALSNTQERNMRIYMSWACIKCLYLLPVCPIPTLLESGTQCPSSPEQTYFFQASILH